MLHLVRYGYQNAQIGRFFFFTSQFFTMTCFMQFWCQTCDFHFTGKQIPLGLIDYKKFILRTEMTLNRAPNALCDY